MQTRYGSEGRIEALWIKRAHRGPMDAEDSVVMEAEAGIVGNADRGGRRQVTLIEAEAFEAVSDELGTPVDPAVRRANLLVRGIRLEATRGRLLQVGQARLRIRGETRPCERMDEAQPGLRERLDPEWRGGAYAQVEVAGTVRVGDPVQWVREEDDNTGAQP